VADQVRVRGLPRTRPRRPEAGRRPGGGSHDRPSVGVQQDRSEHPDSPGPFGERRKPAAVAGGEAAMDVSPNDDGCSDALGPGLRGGRRDPQEPRGERLLINAGSAIGVNGHEWSSLSRRRSLQEDNRYCRRTPRCAAIDGGDAARRRAEQKTGRATKARPEVKARQRRTSEPAVR